MTKRSHAMLAVVTLSGAVLPAFAQAEMAGMDMTVPDAVSAGPAHEILSLYGEGVQIYECKAAETGGNAWTFREPLAILTQDGKTVGIHFGGPTWQVEGNGLVVGKLEAKVDGATPGDVAQLKLSVTRHEGTGPISKTTVIQRLHTRGGVFSGSCDTPGALHLEPYSAHYVFSAE